MISIEQMTPEQKLGFVILGKTDRPENIAFLLEQAEKGACCPIQVKVDKNAPELIRKLRKKAKYPLLIVNDMEEGYLNSDLPRIPMCTLSAAKDLEYTKVFAGAIAKRARADGFSGCWGPVIDLALTAKSPFGNSREFSDSPENMLPFAREMLSVFKSYHFHGTAKHFPRGSSGSVDGHMASPPNKIIPKEVLQKEIEDTYLTLWNEGLLPSIMVGHGIYSSIDPVYPASLSKTMVSMLRDGGFDGVIYTDSLSMMGIRQRFSDGEALRLALNAGNDVILPNTANSARDNYHLLLNEYYSGNVDEEALNNAVRRVSRLAEWCAQEPEAPYPLPADPGKFLRQGIRDSITAFCADGVSPAINPEERYLFVVLTRLQLNSVKNWHEVTMEKIYDENRVIKAIQKHFPNSEIVTTPEYPTNVDTHNVMNASVNYQKIIIVTFSTAAAYLGVDCLTRRTEAMIQAIHLHGKLEAIAHFGNPFALDTIPYCKRKLVGYRTADAQDFLFEILAGKYPANGTFPFPNLLNK